MAEIRKLPLMEMFPTIQGEGYHQGKAAFFVRLGGCDVGCSWCDVKESWDAGLHPLTDVDNIVIEALRWKARIVVITGGEPTMYNLDFLTRKFKEAGFQTHIETAGVYPLTGTWDWITLSPKKFKAALSEFFTNMNELKIIVVNKQDLPWAGKMALNVQIDNAKYYLQPEWSKSKTVMPLITDYVQANTKWQISLQTHKFMDIP